MVAQLFDTTQPDVIDVLELARVDRQSGLRLFAGWREPMGERTQRAVTLSVDGALSAEHLVVELLRLANVGGYVLQVGASHPLLHLRHALQRARDTDQALQKALGLAPGPRAVLGTVGLEEHD